MNWEENKGSEFAFILQAVTTGLFLITIGNWELLIHTLYFHSMAALLAKFRIDYSDVIVIPDITKKAQESTKKEFEALIEPFKADVCEDGSAITEVELMGLREKTNRHLRLRELLQDHSKDSTFVVM